MKTLSSEQRDALEKMTRGLARKLRMHPLLAELTGPSSLLTKKRFKDEYRYLQYLSSTMFSFSGAYLNSSNRVILTATPCKPLVDVKNIEVDIDQANLFGVAFVQSINDRLTGEFERERELIEDVADELFKEDLDKLTDVRYGSW